MSKGKYSDWKKKCPYFKYESAKGHRIVCAGVGDAYSTELMFGDRERERKIQLRVYCEGCYDKCEIYRMLEEAEAE